MASRSRGDVIVGHATYNLTLRLSAFLQRDVNKSFVGSDKSSEVHGLEVPCVYRLDGPKIYIDRMTEL